jgi:hypothetical protein
MLSLEQPDHTQELASKNPICFNDPWLSLSPGLLLSGHMALLGPGSDGVSTHRRLASVTEI